MHIDQVHGNSNQHNYTRSDVSKINLAYISIKIHKNYFENIVINLNCIMEESDIRHHMWKNICISHNECNFL